MSLARACGTIAIASAMLIACSFTRSLDYLQEDLDQPDADATSSSSGTSGTSTSSSGSTSGDFNPDLPPAGDLLVEKQLNPKGLLQDADNLYWYTDDNKVMKLAKSGGAPKELVKLASPERGSITGLAIDPSPGGNLFVIANEAIKTLPRDGGALGDFLPAPTNANFYELVADESYLFVLSTDDDDYVSFTRYPKANPAAPVVISRPVDDQDTGSGAVAVYGNDVYYTTLDLDNIQVLLQYPKQAAAGTMPTLWKNTTRNEENLAAGVNALSPSQLAIDDDAVYWVDDAYHVAYRLPRSAVVSGAPPFFSKSVAEAIALTIDKTNVYVLAKDRLVKMPKSDPGKRTFFNSEKTATAILNDDASLYYVYLGNNDVDASGGIRRIAK